MARTKTDCKHMEGTIHELKEKIEIVMKQRFGRVVDLNDVQEALLKKLVFNLRMSMLDIKALYEAELSLWMV